MLKDTEQVVFSAVIRLRHGCGVTHRGTIFVHETFGGQTLWQGYVEVFELHFHPRSKLCYAWRQPYRDKIKFITVLDSRTIGSAQKAVQAAIFADVAEPMSKAA